MAPKHGDFFQTLRLPILSSDELIYISGIPGKENTLQLVFPRHWHLSYGIFRSAMAAARRGDSYRYGRTHTEPERTRDGIMLHITIETRPHEGRRGFAITLEPETVEEVSAAFRLAEVIQDHYVRYDDASYEYDDEDDVHDTAKSGDGALFLTTD